MTTVLPCSSAAGVISTAVASASDVLACQLNATRSGWARA